jgi:hypothetical protein
MVQFTKDSGLDPISAGLVVGLTQAAKKSSRESRAVDFEIETINPFESDTSVNSFDFNIEGRTAEEILGSKFRVTFFETENARLATMRAIFQRVVDDPHCSDETREICLDTLGKFDPPREQSNNILLSTISTMGALSGLKTGLNGVPDGDRVDPPILGNLKITDPAVTKELFFHLGVPMGEKYKPGGEKPLKFFLQGVASRITMQRMCSDSAYSLLLSVFQGDLHEEIYMLHKKGNPFHDTWNYIQNCAVGQVSRDVLTKELSDLYKAKPANLHAVLTRIQMLRIQIFSNMPGMSAAERESFTTMITLMDYKSLLNQHYGHAHATSVEALFNHELAKQEKELILYERQGLTYKPEDKIRTFKEIACPYIKSQITPSHGPSMIFSYGLSVEEATSKQPTSHLHISSLAAESNEVAQSTSAPSQHSAPSHHSMGTISQGSGSYRGPKKTGSTSGRSQKQQNQNQNQQNQLMTLPAAGLTGLNIPSDQQMQMQAAIQQKQMFANRAMQAKASYETQAPSSYPPPDFTKLLYPIERTLAKKDRSAVPSICWETIGYNTCFLCAVPYHFYDECPLYPGQLPGVNQCGCSGFHVSECRVNLRRLMDHPSKNGWQKPQPPPKREGLNGGQIQYPNQYPNPNNPRPQGQGYPGNYNNNNNGTRYQGPNNRFNNGGGGNRFQGQGNGNGNGNGYNGRRFDNRRNGSNGQGRNGNGDNNNGNGNFGYPNQKGVQGGGVAMDMTGHAMEGINPAGQASNRAGGGLGNSGSQVVPQTAFMNPTQVQATN